jgi:hypothetical protein
MAALLDTVARDADRQRRALLASSDHLLDQLEELRLDDRVDTPPALRHAVQALQHRLGGTERIANPRTLRAAHELVLSVQERLLSRNPRTPAPRRAHPARAAGAPVVSPLPGGARWKILALPPRTPGESDPAWLEAVRLTVERALDRWCWAHHHAVWAARSHQGDPAAALRRAGAAWDDYWRLGREAERLGAVPPVHQAPVLAPPERRGGG